MKRILAGWVALHLVFSNAAPIHWSREGNRIDAMAFSPNSALLAIGSSQPPTTPDELDNGVLEIWDVSRRTLKTKFVQKGSREFGEGNGDVANRVSSAAFSPDGLLVIGSDQVGFIVWEVATGRKCFESHTGHSYSGAQFSPDGRLVASPSNGIILNEPGTKLFDTQSGKEIALLKRRNEVGQVLFVAFSPDGKLLATTGSDCAVTVWDVEQKKIIFYDQKDSIMESVAFAPDGKLLATGSSWAGVLLLYSVTGADADQSAKVQFKGKTAESRRESHRLEFSRDRKYAISSDFMSVLTVWNTGSWTRPEMKRGIRFALSPDGKQVAVIADEASKAPQIWSWTEFLSSAP